MRWKAGFTMASRVSIRSGVCPCSSGESHGMATVGPAQPWARGGRMGEARPVPEEHGQGQVTTSSG